MLYVRYLFLFSFVCFFLFWLALKLIHSSFSGVKVVSERIGLFVLGFILLNAYLLISLPMSIPYLGLVWELVGYEPPQTLAHFAAAVVGAAVAILVFTRSN